LEQALLHRIMHTDEDRRLLFGLHY
jgi:hypothetical protein